MASSKIEAKNHNFEQRAVIKFCVNLGKSPTETKQMIDMAGDGAHVSRSMVFKWHKRFRDGRESIDDDERPGRPTEIGDAIIDDIRHAVQEDGRITVREISELFDLSTSTVHTILTENLKLERLSARWVPRLLKEDEMKERVRASNAFLRRWRKEGDEFLSRIITVDETWLVYYDPETKQQSSMWTRRGSTPPKKAKVTKSAGKHMFIMFMDMEGMILSHAVPTGQTVNADYYCKVRNI